MKTYAVTIQMKATEQYFHIALFIWYVVLTFESVDEILGVIIKMKPLQQYVYVVLYLLCSSNFWVCGLNPLVWLFEWSLIRSV